MFVGAAVSYWCAGTKDGMKRVKLEDDTIAQRLWAKPAT
jgi:hypothetical protein